jgi:hypothetical protein
MDPQVEHYFAGTYSIGALVTRRLRVGVGLSESLAWPDLRFKVKRIAVSGWPWDTTATAEWHSNFGHWQTLPQ